MRRTNWQELQAPCLRNFMVNLVLFSYEALSRKLLISIRAGLDRGDISIAALIADFAA
jgi:hypothetical protein